MPGMLNRRTVSGAMFTCIGLVGLWLARDYNFGSTEDMGAGYFPMILSVAMIALGIAGVLRGLRGGEAFESFSLRPAPFVLAGIVVFGLTVERAGLPIAAFLSTVTAGFGSAETEWRSLLVLAAALAIGSTIVFVYALGLPFMVFPG